MNFSALQTTSKITDEWKYPLVDARASGWLPVEAGHEIYWEEYGAPDGEPVMYLHGGPGGGTTPTVSRFFDPDRYRIILFDQRGCGKSKPNVAADGPELALAENTTDRLVDDINALRDALGLTTPMHVFGGSWGSTLALVYGIRHPQHCRSLVLRGIFLGSLEEVRYTFQGNAAVYADTPLAMTVPGAYLKYPEQWRTFVEMIPPEDRADMMVAYKAIFDHTPGNEAERQRLQAAAREWSSWEGAICNQIPENPEVAEFGETAYALAIALIEQHFFAHNLFLPDGYILANVARIADIPTHIVHGRFDECTPLVAATRLVAAMTANGAPPATYVRTNAGHSAMERENALALTAIMDGLER